MKLRIQGKSLRLRLNQIEVARLGERGRVEETVEFGNGSSLTYALEASTNAAAPQAVYREGSLLIQVPNADAQDWVQSDRVAISGGGPISIAVEKDFQCLHAPNGPDPEAFPNPAAHQHR